MALFRDKYGDGVMITEGRKEVLISTTDGNKVTKCRILSIDTARALADYILQCCKEAEEQNHA